MNLTLLKYPIGGFEYQPDGQILSYLDRIENAPTEIENLVSNLNDDELNWRYRPGGWNLFTLVHHISDSHMNAYIRLKIACTESGKAISPYDEKAWAELDENNISSVNDSIQLLFFLHRKWVTFLKELSLEDLEKTYFHPSSQKHVSIREAIQLYAWHSDHHIAHIKQGISAQGKYGPTE